MREATDLRSYLSIESWLINLSNDWRTHATSDLIYTLAAVNELTKERSDKGLGGGRSR